MISEAQKQNAIARIIALDNLEDISSEEDIPLPLLREWERNLSETDLTGIKANVNALTRVVNGELIGPGTTDERLKQQLESVAVEIANKVQSTLHLLDPMSAKALQLNADTITKLYATLIGKSNTPVDGLPEPSDNSVRLFSNLLKD